MFMSDASCHGGCVGWGSGGHGSGGWISALQLRINFSKSVQSPNLSCDLVEFFFFEIQYT